MSEPLLGPAALAVLIARLTGVAHEMGEVLRRGAFSPNIKERADCSAALFTAEGTLLVQAEHIPVHLGSMPASVTAAVAVLGADVVPGVQVVLNDPFAGGTHLNDITLVAPVFAGDRLVGWVANRAHHSDLGGSAPGSLPANATEIHQEGLRVPPVRFTPEVRAIIVASSRTPVERAGDLAAQVGANELGVQRFAALADAPLDEVVVYGERRMRASVAAIPDGTYGFSDVLDSFGPEADQQRPTTIRLSVEVAGEAITFDFTGTDPQRRGNVNAVEAVTVSAVAWALRSVVDPTIPTNGGALRSVRVVAPAGTVVAAQPPVAVGAGNVEVSQRVADVCLGALAQALPERVPAASQGTMNNVLLGGDGWVSYETIAGGQGGRPPESAEGRAASPAGIAGQSGIHTNMTNTSQVDPQSGPGVPGQSGLHTNMTNTRNTPHRGVRAGFPGPGASVPPAEGEWWSRLRPERRGHRARPPDARRRHGVAHH